MGIIAGCKSVHGYLEDILAGVLPETSELVPVTLGQGPSDLVHLRAFEPHVDDLVLEGLEPQPFELGLR